MNEPWGNDDASWWHQLDLEMQEREEQERIDACNQELALLSHSAYYLNYELEMGRRMYVFKERLTPKKYPAFVPKSYDNAEAF
jgi:hypothetical protein